MQFTATKSLVRGYFYREFLPSHLTAEQLGRAEFLVLLGDDDMERLELDELDIPGSHIHSVEHTPSVFSRQLLRNRNNESPVNLYLRNLDSLVSEYLHSNKRLQVLNLDICGSYLTCIDPVMTQILRFARRNTRTVIATYTNVGRDREQLREGLKSLAICHWVAPEATKRAVDALFNRYVAAKLSQEVSLNMVLRHLFWIRSHLEHVLLSGVSSGVSRGEDAAMFLQAFEQCWEQTSKSVTAPVSYNAWLQAVDVQALPTLPALKAFDLSIQEVTAATYAAANGFYHTGWFTIYSHVSPMTAQKWLEQALQALTASPLLFAAHGASRLTQLGGVTGLQLGKLPVWKAASLGGKCRQALIPETSLGLVAIDRQLTQADIKPVADTSSSATPSLRKIIRDLARQGMNTDQVMAVLPEPKPARASVTAYIANANRNLNRPEA